LITITQSQDEIKRLSEKLDDNEVRLKLQAEIRKLVEKIRLYPKVKKFAIDYHKPKLVYRFKSGKLVAFIESNGEMVDVPVFSAH
jgi:hypothetical protein